MQYFLFLDDQLLIFLIQNTRESILDSLLRCDFRCCFNFMSTYHLCVKNEGLIWKTFLVIKKTNTSFTKSYQSKQKSVI